MPSTGRTYQNCKKKDKKKRKKRKKPLFVWRGHLHFFNAYNPTQQETLQYESWLSVFSLVLLCLLPSMGCRGIWGFANYRRWPDQQEWCQTAWPCKCSISSVPPGFGRGWELSLWYQIWPEHIPVKNTLKITRDYSNGYYWSCSSSIPVNSNLVLNLPLTMGTTT